MTNKNLKQTKKTASYPKQSKKKATIVKGKSYYWMPVLCIIITFIVYTPVFKAGFVTWDDDGYVLDNNNIKSINNIKQLVTQPVMGNHHPLTMLTLMANYAISGEDALSYHIVNLLLHLLNILLVFLFIKRLTGNKPWIAFIVAILFAVHPLHVESVAWVSERKDVLYSLFFLAGLLVYLRYLKTRKILDLLYVFGLFFLSLLSKPAAIIFPLVLIAIDYYYGRLKVTKTYYEKIPFFILSLVFGLVTLQAQKLQGAVGGADLFPLHFRFFFGFYGIMMYVIKTLWPVYLCNFYPFPPLQKFLPLIYYLSPLFGLALIGVLIYAFRRYKLISFAILFYIINLLLVLQFLPVGSAIISDRYSYLPLIGLFIIPGYFLQNWIDAHHGKLPNLAIGILIVITIILSILAFRQTSTWHNSVTLWDNAIRIAPSSNAYISRGLLYKRENNYDKALEMYSNAILINANSADAFINRGNIYFNLKQFEKAIDDYNSCIKIESNRQLAYENRGTAYGSQGKYELAISDLSKAITLDPKTDNGYVNRGVFYQLSGHHTEAIMDFYKQMEVNHEQPAEILNSIAVSYIELNEFENALKVLSQAIEGKGLGASYLKRAIVYNKLGHNSEALSDARKAESLGVTVDKDFMNSLL